ncbi:hypothetical protein HAX54_029918 [Datura stramonium]|uniref:Uncharacterized protein n=1 Tax=Datura stramonium TaxID=4076 RepID=A0ABS8V858_DATST|nr:hypothetical protein [Datura stramonium]
MSQESFSESALRWRLEASRIRSPLPEKELISIFIRIQEGLYLEKFLGACPRSFSEPIQHVKAIDDSIQARKIIDDPNSLHLSQEIPSSSRQLKKRKFRDYTQSREPLSDIFSKLHATEVIQPRKEKVVDPTHPQFDPSKHFYANKEQLRKSESAIPIRTLLRGTTSKQRLRHRLVRNTKLTS